MEFDAFDDLTINDRLFSVLPLNMYHSAFAVCCLSRTLQRCGREIHNGPQRGRHACLR